MGRWGSRGNGEWHLPWWDLLRGNKNRGNTATTVTPMATRGSRDSSRGRWDNILLTGGRGGRGGRGDYRESLVDIDSGSHLA
jgi:hypothetical protein